MKIYYDTEFLEDGKTIDLISIGMVAEDGRELYLVNQGVGDEPLYKRITGHRWLMENVVPHLPLAWDRPDGRKPHGHSIDPDYWFFHLDLKDNRVVPLRFIRNAVREFVLATPEPDLWAWYGAYDHVTLAQLFGRMIDLPRGFPMWTNDLKQECQRLGNPQMPKQAEAEHNALADARHNKVMAEMLGLVRSTRCRPARRVDDHHPGQS